jgi:pyrroline-5-carboxylate reductase
MRIGFFGSGNMAQALALGFKEKYPSVEQYFFTPSQVRAQDLASRVQGHFVEQLTDMPLDLDWYILAFKPQSLNEFSFAFAPNAKILSVLAGTGIDTLEKKFQVKNIARLMPNTPSSVGMGANLLYSPFEVGEMKDMLKTLGKLFPMKSENELDAITAFSGSGPALLFEYARIFEKYLTIMSGGNADARAIVTQTFLGSAKLMESALEKDVSFESLREQVTSKKGVTYEALQIMEKNGLENIMGGAFTAAHKRTLELKKGI